MDSVAASKSFKRPGGRPSTWLRFYSVHCNSNRSWDFPSHGTDGCPTSRSFFARCGIPLRYTRQFSDPIGKRRLRFVVSHISRKTSEMWGTHRFFGQERLALKLHLLFSLHRSLLGTNAHVAA